MSEMNRLSRIDTQWSLIRRANDSQADGQLAQSLLIERYGPAIRRYLLASLRSQAAADEVFQEFALRLVRGDFRDADTHKGRFRNLIKTTLYHLIIDYHRRAQRDRKLGTASAIEHVGIDGDVADEESFTLAWRDTLLESVWGRLEQLQKQTGKPYHTILRARVDQPHLTTKQLIDLLAGQGIELGDDAAFRIFLHRTRRRFAALLVEEVRKSLSVPSEDAVELELIELGLHHYCK